MYKCPHKAERKSHSYSAARYIKNKTCHKRTGFKISSYSNAVIKIYILYCLQQFNTFIKGTLKCFAPKNKTHATGAFVNYCCFNCFLQITCALALTTAIDKTNTAHITI